MAKKGNPIHGWFIIDKTPDMTSADVVRAIKRVVQPKKIGHAGTLDPLATGILPIALGEATKTIPYIVDSEKEYTFTIKFGEETTTDDTEGEVSENSDSRPRKAEILAAMDDFRGEIQQIPPKFSAVKVDGKRAYELARAGEAVELKPRAAHIMEFTLKSVGKNGDNATFSVVCGKGTYIRSLARDLGRKLRCFGHVTSIRRNRVGPFSEKDAISLEKLIDLGHSARALEALQPIMTALDDIPELAITGGEAKRARNGQALQLPTSRSGTVRLTCEGELIALAEVENKRAKLLRVFNQTT